MGYLKFCVLLGALLLSLQGGVTMDEKDAGPGSLAGSSPATKTQHTAKRVDCRGPMNTARTEVGLPDFGEATETSKLPIGETEAVDLTESATTSQGAASTQAQTAQNQGASFIKEFCSALSQGTKPEQPQNQEKGTYLYASSSSNEQEACGAAVKYWRGAVTNFPTLPPAYSSSEQLYTNSRNVSFVGLFNTSSNPAVDCAFITCNAQVENSKDQGVGDGSHAEDGKQTTVDPAKSDVSVSSSLKGTTPADTAATAAEAVQAASEEEKAKERRLSATTNPTYGLLCLSSPQALKNSLAPFTQEQWDKISGATNSSAQFKVVGALAIAVAALVHLLL